MHPCKTALRVNRLSRSTLLQEILKDIAEQKMVHIKSTLLVIWATASFSAVSNGQTCSIDVKCPYFDVFNTGSKDWTLAFRATPYVGVKVLEAYKDGTGVPLINDIGCIQVDPNLPCSHHYRNNAVLDNWQDIDEVAFVVYNQSGLAQYIVFNGQGSNYMNWFSAGRVKESSWTDLKTSSHAYFSIEGYTADGSERRFYITKAHFGSCGGGYAWVMVNDKYSGNCSWLASPAYPHFRYAAGNTAALRPSADYTEASIVAIFVKYL